MNRCTYKNCEEPTLAKDLCKTHYHRSRRGTDMDAPLPSKAGRVVPEWEPGLVTHSPAGNIIKHGGSGMGYRSYGCRCKRCTEANRHRGDIERKKRSSRVIPETVPHGKATTYVNWGCRCDPCTKAQVEKCNGYYAKVLSAEARFNAEMEAYEAGLRKGPKPVRKKLHRVA